MNAPIAIATRGSALALAQANAVLDQCRRLFPGESFELKIIKTTGDKLQSASLSRIDASLPRGLFTKELEMALLDGSADLAVHSLKDLPTELPDGLILAAVAGQRADVRDVLVYRAPGAAARGFPPQQPLSAFPSGAVIATSSSRRAAQLLALRADFKTVEIRGNVPTRLRKVAENPDMDATVLALAGLQRLNFTIGSDGVLRGQDVPAHLCATILGLDEMLPCVGQGALGLETRANDPSIATICDPLNHLETFQSVIAERAFLRAMGGGCQTPVAAHAAIHDNQLSLRAVSFLTSEPRRAETSGNPTEAESLGVKLAAQLR